VTAPHRRAWFWLAPAIVLILLGLFVVEGTAGTIILACGFLGLLGAGISIISRNDPRPPEERRVPAGHSGV
jgi:VIT1/CCC1 family predicted Fe2+/Mn2+ transporter